MKGILFLSDGSTFVLQPDELEQAAKVTVEEEAIAMMTVWIEHRRALLKVLCGGS